MASACYATGSTNPPKSDIKRVYGPAIGVRSKERINGTRMTLLTRIIADKTPNDQRQSALSAPSAFYEAVMNAVINYPN
jgi:hypothetical protein